MMNVINAINEFWNWVGIEPEEIIGENEFGNLLIRDVQGKYWRLCPEDVYCKVIAENRNELDALTIDQEFLADWYMRDLTALAKQNLGALNPGRKYHLAIPGILGGEYGVANIRTVSQIEQIRFAGDVGRQIQELPDGAQIKLKVIE